jgi:hypothetical protein
MPKDDKSSKPSPKLPPKPCPKVELRNSTPPKRK